MRRRHATSSAEIMLEEPQEINATALGLRLESKVLLTCYVIATAR